MDTSVPLDDDVTEATGLQSPERFPAFEIPADAPGIEASHIQRVLDEEGLC